MTTLFRTLKCTHIINFNLFLIEIIKLTYLIIYINFYFHVLKKNVQQFQMIALLVIHYHHLLAVLPSTELVSTSRLL